MSKFYSMCLLIVVLIATAVFCTSCESKPHRRVSPQERAGTVTAAVDSCDFFYGDSTCMIFIERTGFIITAYTTVEQGKAIQSLGKRIAFRYTPPTRGGYSYPGCWEIVGASR